ncbi:MAG: hypothetical protein RMJ87_01000 [Cytophagales bacterium]|nr:hypothetical protein [Bernardetiaceae bacterium]MDW8203578.1 hypothetical protein [Cytophagales bacterium]
MKKHLIGQNPTAMESLSGFVCTYALQAGLPTANSTVMPSILEAALLFAHFQMNCVGLGLGNRHID